MAKLICSSQTMEVCSQTSVSTCLINKHASYIKMHPALVLFFVIQSAMFCFAAEYLRWLQRGAGADTDVSLSEVHLLL